MDTWVPPAISGAFSVVVVLLGAWLVHSREERSWKQQLEKEQLQSQRKAVVNYIRAMHAADAQWEIDCKRATDPLTEINEKLGQWDAIEHCYNTFLSAGTELEMELTNPVVAEHYRRIKRDIKEEWDRIAATVSYNTVESWSEIILHRPLRPALVKELEALTETARNNLHPTV